MGFLDTVTSPTKPKVSSAKGGSGFLSTVSVPPVAEQNKISSYQQDASASADAAAQANSFSGLFKNTLSSIWDTTKSYVSSSVQQAKDFVTNPANTPKLSSLIGFGGPIQYNGLPQHVVDAFKDSFNYGEDAVSQMLSDYKNGTGSTAGDVANLAKLTSAVAGMLFSPVNGTMKAAQDFPVLKQVADAVNAPFSVLGITGAYASGKVLDVLPISQDSKDILKKPIGDLGSLAAQVFVGGKIMELAGDHIGKGGEITPAEANRIVNQVKIENPEVFRLNSGETNPNLLLEAPKGTAEPIAVGGDIARESTKAHTDYMQQMGYEPITPAEQLPTIDYGKTPKTAADGLPKIDFGKTPTGEIPGYTYEPLPQEKALATEARSAATPADFIKAVEDKKIDVPKSILKPEATKVALPKTDALEKFYEKSTASVEPQKVTVDKPIGEGETRKSTLASKVEAQAVEKKLTDGFGQLPEYKRVNLKEQAKFASDIVSSDVQKATDMVMGREPVPSHVLPEALFTALEEHATKTGNVDLLRQLATESPLSLEATAMGQRIRALGERAQDSPVRLIQEVRDAREAAIEKKTKGTVDKAKVEIAKDIKTEIKKAVSARPSWDEFIQEIQCKY